MTINDVIPLPIDEKIINKTIENVIKKYKYTYNSLMYVRTPMELLDNLFMGDIAKNAIYEYLRNNCKNPVIDYDDIRTDDFRNADPGWALWWEKRK